MQIPPSNRFTNEKAGHVWIGVFALFVLWWLFVLLANLLGGLFRRRRAVNPAVTPATNVEGGAVVPAPVPTAAPTNDYRGGFLRRIERSLEILFLSTFAVVTVNYLTNGITDTFALWFWITVALGVLWALARGLVKRFADLLLFALIPLFVFLWVCTLSNRNYVGDAVD